MIRTPLREINGNRQGRIELSTSLRQRVAGAHDCKVAKSSIARLFEIPRSTVRNTIKLDPLRIDQESLPRSGRPRLVTDRDERYILRFVRQKPKATYPQIQRDVPTTYSRSTIYRILKDAGITNWLCKRRPFLSYAAVEKRKKWCGERIEEDLDYWRTLIFSDEYSLKRGAGKKRE
jgi:transposase